MKNLPLALLLLVVAALPLQAQNLLTNGDFSNGTDSWQGDGLPAREFTASNPSISVDAAAKGIFVALNDGGWTRIFQQFDTDTEKDVVFSAEITLKILPGITISQNAVDYEQIGTRLNVASLTNFRAKSVGHPGQFYELAGDVNTKLISGGVFSPKIDSTESQTFKCKFAKIPSGHNVFVIGFPPGTGAIQVLSVTLMKG